MWAPYIMFLAIEEGVRSNCLIAEQEVQNVSYESFQIRFRDERHISLKLT